MKIGDLVIKKSGKPFKHGLIWDEVELFTTHPQHPKQIEAVKLKNSDTIVSLVQLVEVNNLRGKINILSPSEIREMNIENKRKNIVKFLSKFPDNADCWSKATDEVRDLARWFKEHYNDSDLVQTDKAKELAPCKFDTFKTPSCWNREGKLYIMQVWDLMDSITKEKAYNDCKDWFEDEE